VHSVIPSVRYSAYIQGVRDHVLRRVFGPKWQEVTSGWRNSIVRSFFTKTDYDNYIWRMK
jgi:hypothetical protein